MRYPWILFERPVDKAPFEFILLPSVPSLSGIPSTIVERPIKCGAMQSDRSIHTLMCVRRRHMVYYHITWLASKSNSPLLASDQSTVELCIPASTCAHTNRTTCVRRHHFPWECTTNQIWHWQPSESPNIAKWRPPHAVSENYCQENWTKIEKESASKYLNDLFW